MDAVLLALQMVATPTVLVVMLLSGIFGMFVGAVPGLTATMATALLVPITFFLPPVPAVAVAIAATLVIHTCFYKLLKVPLPWGVLQRFAW